MNTEEKLRHLEDPQFVMENRLPPHSDHSFYQEGETPGGDMGLKISLNGVWKFHLAPNPRSVPQSYQEPGFSCAGWGDIRVPGHMELQGYGKPQYVDTCYPWDGVQPVRPHEVPAESNPTGCYVRSFSVPEAWNGKEIHITFDGVETAFHLWCNGGYVGYSEDSYTPSEFDLTPFLKAGENKLAVEVYRFCTGTWLEDQDFWRMGGIMRSVSLTALPAVHLEDLKIDAGLEEDGTGTLRFRGKLRRAVAAEVEVRWTLLDPEGKKALEGSVPAEQEAFSVDSALADALPWSAERPHLYSLRLTLCSRETGSVYEIVPYRVGFRRVEIKNQTLLLNGKRLVFRGVNRHEFSAEKGRAIGREEMEWDIRFLKQNNFNAVRTSHYPNQSDWYELCDSYGIYLIDETNLETHGTWHMGADENTLPGDDPAWLPAVLNRAEAMVERDRNHASVLVWSCGNESWGGKNLYEMSQRIRALDPTRPVHYEGVCHDRRYQNTTDFESRMYTTAQQAAEYLENKPAMPYLHCEYSHAMGNSCGGLFKYTELADRYPQYAGGFIWDYIDQALSYPNPLGQRDLAFGGDFGDRPSNYCFCTDGLLFADRTPSPKMQEVKFLYQDFRLEPDRSGVTVRNKSPFSDGGEYRMEWLLFQDGALVKKGESGFCQPPLSSRYYPLFPREIDLEGEVTLEVRLVLREDTLYAEKGHEAAFGQAVWNGRPRKKGKEFPAPSAFRVVDGDDTYGIHGDDFSVLFCKTTGRMVSLKSAGREFIGSPLRTVAPNFWRAPTPNDEGFQMEFKYSTWKTASLYGKPVDISFDKGDAWAGAAAKYDLGNGAFCTLRYTVSASGEITVREEYQGADGLPEMPAFGFSLSIPAEYRFVEYYGLGPEENYIDRCKGARLGLFQTTPQRNMTPYLIPQECGNRTGVRWACVCNGQGHGLRIEGEHPFELSVLPYTSHELENAYHRYELPPVSKTVLCVNQKQMGVGGDDSWKSMPHPEFRIPSDGNMAFQITLRLL